MLAHDRGRILQNIARPNRLKWGELLRCLKSAASITVTRAEPHEGIFGAMSSA